MNTDQLKQHIDNRLDRIEQLLRGIHTILDLNTDAAQDAHDIRQRLKKSQDIIRQLEYERLFNEETKGDEQ